MSKTPLPISRRLIIISTLGLSATTLLAGCAKGSGGQSGGKSSEVLNIGQISDSVAFFPLFVAEQKGYFKDAGVTLGSRPRLGTGAKLAAALQSGAIDLGAGVLTDAYNLHSVNTKARLYSALVTEYYVDVVVGSSLAGSSKASLDDRIKSLVGKKIGITGPGSGTEALLIYLFQQIGKDAKRDATLVNLGGVATSAIGALKTGRVDALSFFQPIGQIAEAQKVGSIFISPQRGDIPSLKGDLHGCVFSTTNLVEKKKDAVAGFNKAMDDALSLIQGDAGETKSLLTSYLKNSSPEVVASLAKIVPAEMSKTHKITESSYNVGREFHVKTGLAKNAPAFADFVAAEAKA